MEALLSRLPLDQRHWAAQYILRLAPVRAAYCIVWEGDAGAGLTVTYPDSNWLAHALHGWVLSPIESWLDDHARYQAWLEGGGDPALFSWEMIGGRKHKSAKPIGPLTERAAMEYLVQKDIPRRVWDARSNRPKVAIVRQDRLPQDMRLRNAWRLSDIEEAV